MFFFFLLHHRLAHTSLSYEKVCVLFDIAALQSHVAAVQQMDNDEGLKLAIKLLQQSAGIFQYLKGAVPAAVPSEPTPDLNQDTLTVMQALMISQAQEVFVMKAIKGKFCNKSIECGCQVFRYHAQVYLALIRYIFALIRKGRNI